MLWTGIGWAVRPGVNGLLIGLTAIFVAGCAHESGPPNWIEHPGRAWPPPQYVTGVGQGDDPEAAATAARAEIARKTKGERDGIEIARTYVAKRPTVHWALAVLDRPALIAHLAEQIAAGDEKRAANAEAAKGEAPEKAVALLLEAIALTREREALRERIAHLEGTPPPSDTPPTRATLDEQLAGVRHALTIAVEAYEMDPESGEVGAPLDSLRRALAQQVLAKGFALPVEGEWGDSAPAWLRVRARVGTERLDLGGSQGFVAVEWEAAVEIEDPSSSSRVIALLGDHARATHVNERSARRLARQEATQFVTEALGRWLDERYAPAP